MGQAKKRFGQHFLINQDIAKRIVGALPLSAESSTIIEVGPGKGMLTQYLETAYDDLYLIEADRDMVAYIQDRFPDISSRLIQADFLKLNLSSFNSFHLIGNFPYNISSQILFKVLDNKHQIPVMVGMFQKEVAERIAAREGSKTYGILSVLTQAFYSCEYLFTVKPGSFVPAPKVYSGVIRLERDHKKEMTRQEERFFRMIVKLAFNQRRKMLRNSLKSVLSDCGLENNSLLSKRPEQLSVEQFIELAEELNRPKSNQYES